MNINSNTQYIISYKKDDEDITKWISGWSEFENELLKISVLGIPYKTYKVQEIFAKATVTLHDTIKYRHGENSK